MRDSESAEALLELIISGPAGPARARGRESAGGADQGLTQRHARNPSQIRAFAGMGRANLGRRQGPGRRGRSLRPDSAAGSESGPQLDRVEDRLRRPRPLPCAPFRLVPAHAKRASRLAHAREAKTRERGVLKIQHAYLQHARRRHGRGEVRRGAGRVASRCLANPTSQNPTASDVRAAERMSRRRPHHAGGTGNGCWRL